MKNLKKILASLLVVVMVLTAAPLGGFVGLELPDFDFGIRASALAESGQCGDNVFYTYNSSTGELVISGTGKMYDYYYNVSPFYDSIIKSVVIEDGVTTIGHIAFYNCTSLESVTIGDSVTSIDSSAFYNCTSLTSVTIPDSVTSIGNSAFYNCTSLTSVTIPDSVTSIGNDAFRYCTSLTSVTIGDGVTSFAGFDFSQYGKLEALTIGSGIKEIPANYFDDMTSLKTVNLSEGLEKIGDYAFNGCTYLENIDIPDSVTYIGEDILHNTAWFNYKEQGLLTLDGWIYGFKGDVGYNIHVAIASGIKSITDGAFKDIDIVSYDVDTNNMFFSSEEGVLFNKDKTELILYPVGKDDYSYSIPNSVISIGEYAFYNCNTLKNITIPNGVTSIKQGAFYQCSNLSSIDIPDSVITIGKYAFYNCSLTKIELGKNIKSIENYAFLGSNSASVFISDLAAWCKINFYGYYYDDMDYIVPYSNPLSGGGSLYINDKKAVNLIVPETITEIKSATFYGCSSIETVIIPDCGTKISGGAFAECRNLKAIEIGNGVSVIGDEAFRRCNSLINVTFGESIKSIKSNAFNGCDNIKNIYYPGSQKEWEAVSGRSHLSNANLFLMHSHEYTETVIKQVTCEEDGEILYACKHGDTKTEIIPAIGHNWVDMGGSVKATCSTDGVDNYKCSNCGEEKKGTTPAFDHDWDYIEHTYATCEKDGYMSRVCLREGCGVKEEKVTPASHNLGWWDTKEPTCTEPGAKYIGCLDCSYSFAEAIPANGHTYSEWVELLPATCSERGLNIKICNECNDIQRQIIPKLAHVDADGNGVCDNCESTYNSDATDKPEEPDAPEEPDTPEVPDTPDIPDDPEEEPCDCDCHAGGIKAFFFNFLNFFAKLFNKDARTCECGAAH